MIFRKFLATFSVAATALLVACGGGGSSTPAAIPTPTNLAGNVVDGYIEGATVCLDVNNNQVCDADEPSAVTKADGSYKLDTSAVGAAQIAGAHLIVNVPTTAKDADDGGQTLAAAGKSAFTLMAPASKPDVISPLTTLVSHELLNDPGKGLTEAQSAVRVRTGMASGEDVMQDFVKNNKSAVKNTAIAIALALGETRKALDASGVTATEQQKILATLNALQTQVTDLMVNLGTDTKPTPAKVKTGMATKLAELSNATTAKVAIEGTIQTASPINLAAGFSIYDGYLCANGTTSNGYITCTQTISNTVGTTAGKLTSVQYGILAGKWQASSYPSTGLSYALNPTTNSWVVEPSTSNGDFVVDATGSGGTYTESITGAKTRVVLRQEDIGNKNISTLSGFGTVPASLSGLVFPAGSLRYNGQFTRITDRYYLWGGVQLTDYSTNVPTAYATLDAWMAAHATGNANNKRWTLWSSASSAGSTVVSNASVSITFDTVGATTAGGTLTVTSGYSYSNPGTTLAEKGAYEWRTFGAIKVLVITKLPGAVAKKSTDGLLIFADKDGKAFGGTLYPAGYVESNTAPSFNKTAFAAMIAKLGLPTLP